MASEKTFRVKGMHCASCAGIIERTFKKQKGVKAAEVNYGTETAKVTFDEHHTDHHQLSQSIEPLGYSLETPMTAAEMGMSEDEHAAHMGLNQSKEEKLKEIATMKSQLNIAIPIAIFSVFVMGWDILAEFEYVAPMTDIINEFFQHLQPIMASYILFVVSNPYLLGFYRFLRSGKTMMDTMIVFGTTVEFL